MPQWAATQKSQPDYRYLAIREKMPAINATQGIEERDFPFQTIHEQDVTYKLFGLVTNRTLEGSALIQWHRARCGKSEQVHHTQKAELAGGQLPSNLFGVNAAWWQITILAFNLGRLMQVVALPVSLKERQMKALRFHVIQCPGRVIRHARELSIRVEQSVSRLYAGIRERIAALGTLAPVPLEDTS